MRHRTFPRIAAAATAATAVAIGGSLGTAEATKTVRIKSHISIKAKELKFRGRVTSSNAGCKPGRTVVLYRKFSDGSRQRLGTDTTGPKGVWKIRVSGSAGISMARFVAKVKTRREGTAGTIYVCKGAHSRTISFQP
jgi:glutamate synthase domain-containing protein 3